MPVPRTSPPIVKHARRCGRMNNTRLVRSLELLPPAIPGTASPYRHRDAEFNHGRFLRTTIDSVLAKIIPSCSTMFGTPDQDTARSRFTKAMAANFLAQRSRRRADAVNQGFAGVDCDIMAYLNSDDTLLPGTLAHIANFFDQRPTSILSTGIAFSSITGSGNRSRLPIPAHDPEALKFAGYVPQRRCSGAALYGTRSGRWTPHFTTRWTGTSCCAPRPRASKWRGCGASLHASAYMTSRKRQKAMSSAGRKCRRFDRDHSATFRASAEDLPRCCRIWSISSSFTGATGSDSLDSQRRPALGKQAPGIA